MTLRIQYDGEPVLPAGERTANSIAWVEVAGDREAMRHWLGNEGLDVRVVSGPVGLRAVGVGRGAFSGDSSTHAVLRSPENAGR